METRTVQQPPPCSSSSGSPAGATRQEARRVEGDSRRRGQEAALRDRAPLSQQRRLRQATQFLHKDSADLLPLDSLKRLGTSKDLPAAAQCDPKTPGGGKPESVSGGVSPRAGPDSQPGEQEEDQQDTDSCSSGELQVPRPGASGGRGHRHPTQPDLSWVPQPPGVREGPQSPRWGRGTWAPHAGGAAGATAGPGDGGLLSPGCGLFCFQTIPADVESPEFCLGLQTLLSLKCCIDLEHGVLRLRAPFSELPFLPLYQGPGQ
ncbi:nuclear receptor-interacting protein 2 isoform X1 [Prionailurus viverrinus]|uniref:nuclear receptor-interacting protein 2 isoform X1 n=1 Tax=Prionailurus viverrinus TaxID=61388 RepID=UPI001FF5A383|nr:nuclear receptor-interacting protein 2 isoform X1 [Prionailurus viverrinus]